ncbi:TetR/AcrR family transcriptional regulator [Sphingomonas sp. Root241]|uniref:TetR/AcrR family transcriptional regulator n=1 Tax=Sphingomonas sp. Root241 TaxID=1736501 RepID=UPI0006F8E9DD|nr:TetR/AcrR family transcriptional regulator [Sphingomonas sp. Root241]KRC79627.1 TetR family transcriptional regulator [Sphingomonas sp. Root241]
MARAVSTIPRKSASQKRSQATVDTLLDATARVLVREGYDRASTNRIAAVAGVSIGSLYQYFPGKEALVTALVARHNREMLALLRGAMAAVATLSVAEAVRLLVAAMIDAHRVDPELHRIFDEQVPRMGQLAGIEAIEQETFALVRAFFEARHDEITVRDLDTATYICVTSVETLTHDFVIRRPEASAAEQAAMVEEITRLLVGYLEPTARAA